MSFIDSQQTKLESYVFTSESVAEGHPDKICDQISDAILDAMLQQDPLARTAIEVLVTTNRIIIAGEIRGNTDIDKAKMEQIARNVVKEIGYQQPGFHYQKLSVEVYVHEQSKEIAQGVDSSDNKEEGAGDQGIMFGYACDETDVFMPAPIVYSHRILEKLAQMRKTGEVKELGPDAKSQVSLLYKNGIPVKATSVIVSTQHKEGLTQSDVKNIVKPVVESILPKDWMCDDKNFLVNPTGSFVLGGPDGDCGLTGRKIIVDTYGGAAPHGGGAFSGKDPSKVDRSAAYMARYIAKNIVAAKIAKRCTIQLAYAIGVAKPTAFYINCHGTGNSCENKLAEVINEMLDLTPRGIRTYLGLNRPIYQKTATYGHFGRQAGKDGSFSWEKLDLVESLKKNFDLSDAA